MKAAVFYGKHDIRICEIPVREPESGEATIEVAFCGVCGTDLHIYHGDEGSATVHPPRILGHEFAGTVVKIGEDVGFLKIGDRVYVDPNIYCGVCYYCRSGKEHFCDGMVGVGVSIDGGFAQYCTLPAKTLLPVGNDLPFREAAFLEPIACCLHGIDLTGITTGDRVAIIGGGTIGLIMLQLARLAGASELILIEPNRNKRELAASLGADFTYGSCEEFIDNRKNNKTTRVDRVIECVGKPETVTSAIEIASKGATVMIFGLTSPESIVEIHPFEIFKKELKITSSFVNPKTQARALDLLISGRIKVDGLISVVVPVEKLAEILSDNKYRELTKILISF